MWGSETLFNKIPCFILKRLDNDASSCIGNKFNKSIKKTILKNARDLLSVFSIRENSIYPGTHRCIFAPEKVSDFSRTTDEKHMNFYARAYYIIRMVRVSSFNFFPSHEVKNFVIFYS